MAIHVKTTGTDKGWQYRIWSNNQVELWWSSDIQYNTDHIGAGIQGLYLTSAKISLPFSVVDASISASIQWGFSEWVQAQIDNKNIVQVRRFGSGNTNNIKTQMTYMYIIGTLA